MKKCEAIASSGQRCQRLIKASESFCFSHDPLRAEERRRCASKAARAKNAGSELVQIKTRLKELSEDVVAGRLSTAKGSVAAQILGVYLRAVEQERKLKETQEFEERLAALEGGL